MLKVIFSVALLVCFAPSVIAHETQWWGGDRREDDGSCTGTDKRPGCR